MGQVNNNIDAITFCDSNKGYIALGKLDNARLQFLFDTGAVVSIVPLHEIMCNVKTEHYKVYRDVVFTFIGVHGKPIDAYFCILYNIQISDVIIKEFYCYITVAEGLSKCLVGRDFLNMVSFQHTKGFSNIIISAFSHEDYKKNAFKVYASLRASDWARVVDKNIESPIEEELHKDVAAAFRDMYEGKFGI